MLLPDGRLNVVLLTSSLRRGGAERQVVELANALDPERFRVCVCSLSQDNPLATDLRHREERLVVIPKRRTYDLALVVSIARLLSRVKADVVHSFMFDAEIVGRLAGRWARVPAVICSNRCPHHGRGRLKRWVSRATAPCFDVLIANSWAGLAYERDTQGVHPSRLCVVPNGIDVNRFRPGRCAEARRELGIPAAGIVVGMVAHFRANKDHATLIEAAASVVRVRRDAYFVMVGAPDGDGDDSIYRRCQSMVTRHGIGDRVRFTGTRGDVARLYQSFDVAVLSTHFEGMPNVVLEAMASGLPVIASDVSDNRRIVCDGVSGVIVPPRDADALARQIVRLAADARLRDAIGVSGRQRVEREYSVAALGQRTADVYVRVLRQKGYVDGNPRPQRRGLGVFTGSPSIRSDIPA